MLLLNLSNFNGGNSLSHGNAGQGIYFKTCYGGNSRGLQGAGSQHPCVPDTSRDLPARTQGAWREGRPRRSSGRGLLWCVPQTAHTPQNPRLANGRQPARDLGTRTGRPLGWPQECGVTHKPHHELFLSGIRQEATRGREQVSGGEASH